MLCKSLSESKGKPLQTLNKDVLLVLSILVFFLLKISFVLAIDYATAYDSIYDLYGILGDGTNRTGVYNMTFQVKSCAQSDCSDGIWSSIYTNSTHNDISSLSNNRYFQYIASFYTEDQNYTAMLFNVTVGYNILPIITLITPINNSGDNDGNITFNYNVTGDLNILNCSLIFKSIINQTNSSITKDITQKFNLNNLAVGNYNWSINCSDSNFNNGTSETRIFSVIKTTEFSGDTTNLSQVNISNITNLIIEQPNYGKIQFLDNINLSNGADLNTYINISQNYIYINSTALPALNKSANLMLYNLTFSDLRILKDGVVCSSSICNKISYTNNNLLFSVTGFSAYSSEETPSTDTTTTTNTGGSSSSGGGGKGSRKTTEVTGNIQSFETFNAGTTKLNVNQEYVTEIDIITNREAKDVNIDVKELITTNVEKPIGNVYRYFEITHDNLPDSHVTKADITFKIQKNIAKDKEINLYRYNNKWTKLPTTKIKEDDTFNYYKTESPGLSLFAIVAESKYLEETTKITNEILPIKQEIKTKQELSNKEILLYGILPLTLFSIILIVLFIIFLKLTRKTKKLRYLIFYILLLITLFIYAKTKGISTQDIFYYGILPIVIICLIIYLMIKLITSLVKKIKNKKHKKQIMIK